MRLLVISGAFPPRSCGESTNTFFLCRHLAKRGVDVQVLASQGSETDCGPGVTVHPIMRRWSWREVPRMRRFLKACAPDAALLMYIGSMYEYRMMPTYIPLIAKRAVPGLPFVTRFEHYYGPRRSLLLRAVYKMLPKSNEVGRKTDSVFGSLLSDSDRVIVLSSTHRDFLAKHFLLSTSKTDVIPPPPNMLMSELPVCEARQKGRARFGLAPDDFVLVFLGYLYKNKGLETLLDAFRLVHSRRPKVRCVIVGGASGNPALGGPSYAQGLRERARTLGIDDKVFWSGEYRWNSDEASVLLRSADICVLPFDEGMAFNNSSFASAVGHGLPIITTPGAAPEEGAMHLKNVYFCPPKNADALAHSIEELIDNPALRASLSTGATQLAHEFFSWEGATERTLNSLERAASAAHGSSPDQVSIPVSNFR